MELENVSVNRLITDIVRNQFNDIIFEVIQQEEYFRISLIKDSDEIPRVFAISSFSENYSPNLNTLHIMIKKGGLIGETFRCSGINMTRKAICNFSVKALDIFEKSDCSFSMGLFSEIYVNIDGVEEFYCDLCEIFCCNLCIDFQAGQMSEVKYRKLVLLLGRANISVSSLTIIT